MNDTKRKVHEIWKEDPAFYYRKWKVQCPRGILSFLRKRDAVAFVEKVKKLGLK